MSPDDTKQPNPPAAESEFEEDFEEEEEEQPEPEPEIILTLARGVKPLTIKDEAGTPHKYLLREMSGLEKDDWLNGIAGRITKGKVQDNKNAHASLIARCLYDEMNRKVPLATISQYPSSVQLKLFKLCETLNGLDLKGREEAKND